MLVGDPVTFTADTGNIEPDSTQWDLGDGTHFFGVVMFEHAYGASGSYRACLWAVETVCSTLQSSCQWISVSGGGGDPCLTGGPDCPDPR